MSPLYINESVQRVNSLICVLIAARRDDSHVDPAQLLDELIQLQGFAYAVRDSIMEAKEAALAEPEQRVWCACGDSIEPDSGAKCGNCVAGDNAEPEQEPVAWMVYTDGGASAYVTDNPNDLIGAYRALPLYTAAPTPRKPLTDEEIALISGECAASAYRHDDVSFARAVIAAFEKKQGGQHE